MCEPTTVMMLAGAALSAVSQIQQGQAAKATSKYNAALAENNAIAARQQAAFQEARQREQAERQLAAQRVRFGKSGATAEGTALDVTADQAARGELDALNIRRSGVLQSHAYSSQATLDRFRGQEALTSAMMGAGSSLLMAGSKVDWGKPKAAKLPVSTNPAHYAPTGGFMDGR